MDEINAFFDLSKPLQRVNISSSTTRAWTRPQASRPKSQTSAKSSNYGEKYLKREQNELLRRFNDAPSSSSVSQLEDLSDDSSDSEEEDTDPIYEKYAFDFNNRRDDLPIFAQKDEILETLSTNLVMVLQGSTGCGKTTQVRWNGMWVFGSCIIYGLIVSVGSSVHFGRRLCETEAM